MKIMSLVVTVLAGLLVAGSTSVLAQQKGEGQGPGADRTGQSTQERQQERVQDRERISSPDRLMLDPQDRDRDQTKDPLKDRDQDRDRDRIHQDEIYGAKLMTEGEMLRYRTQIQNAASEQERQMIQTKHREEMRVRAREKGIELEEPVE